MQKISLIFLVCCLMACTSNQVKETEASLGLIPKPSKTIINGGEFTITKNTRVVATGAAKVEAEKFIAATEKAMGYKLDLTDVAKSKNTIVFELSDTLTSINNEGYLLDVSSNGITVRALKPAGLFYGIQTIRQLLPETIYSEQLVENVKWTVPNVSITDAPRFGWRGYMLDVSRNFFDAEHVKRLIDRMAVHKLNLFHWHLTDDEGWRVEIKSYPKLTEVGAWRGKNEALEPSRGSGDARYGGFYTQEEIKEIVAYAAERHIQIMPEIDVPGHARAIVVAYPELLPDGTSNSKSVQGIANNVLSPVKEKTYTMLDTIFGELKTLFPFEYIHIGGDEVNTSAWMNSPSCVKFMRENNINSGRELQNYFNKRMEVIIANHGKKIMGWNEIIDGGELNLDTAVMSWTGTGPGFQSAKKGHPVIMAPGQHVYFDMKSSKDDEFGHWWAGIVSIEKVYEFDPFDKNDLTDAQLENILGVQACLWSEYLFEDGRAEYQTWPRLTALAEVAWTPQSEREFTDFYNRLGNTHLQRLDVLNVKYRVPQPKAVIRRDTITIHTPWEGAEVRYTTDASEPTKTSVLYSGTPFYIEDYQNLRMKLFTKNGNESRSVKEVEIFREIAAEWTAKDCATEFQKVNFDITGIDANGFWYLDFVYKHGGHRLDMRSVKLLENGTEISSDIHNGFSGNSLTNNRYRVQVKDFNASKKYSIEVEMRSDGGTNSNGIISIERAEFKEPTVSFETIVKAVKNGETEKATDWNRRSYFKSLEKGKKGSEFVFTFSEVLEMKNLEVLSGHPSKNEDIIVDGTVLISEDGIVFEKLSGFDYGASKNTFEPSKKVKAVKIVLNEDHETPIIIQDLKIK
jgi:hexosaminidase